MLLLLDSYKYVLVFHLIQLLHYSSYVNPFFFCNRDFNTLKYPSNVDGVISTDTSLLHLSANLNVTTYALLTLGCEWRWTHDEPRTNWYPNMKLLRQKEFGKWDNVVLELIDELKSNKV